MWQSIPFGELPEELRQRWDPDTIQFQKRLMKVRHCELDSYKILYTRDRDGTVKVHCWKRHNTQLSTMKKALAGGAIITIAAICIILVTQPGIIPGLPLRDITNTTPVQENVTPTVSETFSGYTGLYQKGAVATDRFGKEGMAIANNDLAGNYLVIQVIIDNSRKGWHTNGSVKAVWLPYHTVEEQYPIVWPGGIIDANHIPDRDWSLYLRNVSGSPVEPVRTTPFLTAVPTSTMPPAWMTTIPTYTYYQLTTTDLEQALFLATNRERHDRGLAQLQWDPELAEIALEHSRDMATKQYVSHTNPAGEDPTARAIRYRYPVYKDLGNGTIAEGIAENIAKMPLGSVVFQCPDETIQVMANSDSAADAMMDAWINHDSCQGNGHRDNILNPQYDRVGIGVAFDGLYYIATQEFW